MEEKKQIAILHPSMIFGGAEKVLVNMLHYFDYEHYDVDLYLFRHVDDLTDQIDKRVNIIYKEENPSGRKQLTDYAKSGKLYSCIKLFIGLFWGRMICKKSYSRYLSCHYWGFPMLSPKRYDAIIVYQSLGTLQMYFASHKMFAKKRIAWLHGDGSQDVPTDQYEKMDKIFCVSKGVKESLISNHPTQKSKVEVFYNLINTEEIAQKANRPIKETIDGISIVTVARLTPEKGIIMVPRIARLLLEAGRDFKWYVIGDGPERKAIEEEIASQKVLDRVVLLGSKDNPYPYMKNCTIYVQPSYSEGYCTTTNETRVLCKPVVTTNVPGMNEQFKNGENGWIVGGFTPNDLFEGIQYMLDHPELQKKFSENLLKENTNSVQELNKLYSFINS